MKENKIEKLILDLSNRWEVSPEEAVDRLNSMNESEINKLIKDMAKKFKNGGFIDCLRGGGSVKDCGCGSKIEKAQQGFVTPTTTNGELFKGHPTYSPNKKIAFDDNPMAYFIGGYKTPLYIHKYRDFDSGNTVDEYAAANFYAAYNTDMPSVARKRTSPNFGERVTYSARKAWPFHTNDYGDTEYINDKKQYKRVASRPTLQEVAKGIASQNEAQLLPPLQVMETGGVIKAQDGISMREVRQAIRDNGLVGSGAYANMKNALRNAGLRGKELRQTARRNVVSSAYPVAVEDTTVPQLPVLDDVVIDDEPMIINESFSPLQSSQPTVQKMDRFGGNFNNAFAAARRSGLDKFYWTDPTGKNSGWKTTELGKSTPTQGAVAETSAVVETPKRRTFISQLWDPHPEALPTHDRYAANKQKTREFLDRYSPRAKVRK